MTTSLIKRQREQIRHEQAVLYQRAYAAVEDMKDAIAELDAIYPPPERGCEQRVNAYYTIVQTAHERIDGHQVC